MRRNAHNPLPFENLLTLGWCRPFGWPVTGGWRPYSRPLACFVALGYFSGHFRPIGGTNPNRSAKILLVKWYQFYFPMKLHFGRYRAAIDLGQHP